MGDATLPAVEIMVPAAEAAVPMSAREEEMSSIDEFFNSWWSLVVALVWASVLLYMHMYWEPKQDESPAVGAGDEAAHRERAAGGGHAGRRVPGGAHP